MHFSIILIIFKKNKIKYPQSSYDNLFFSIENNLRELGFGDVAVNKKMKDINKIFYDILIKLNIDENPQIPQKFGVRGIPTMLLFKDGDLKATKVGSTPKSDIVSWIKENI